MTSSSDPSIHYKISDRYKNVNQNNVWIEYPTLAKEYNAVSLGQGFPDYESIPYLNEKIEETLKESNPFIHQYTRSLGHPRLVNALAKCYSKFFNREIDPLNEVLITIGAYESLHNALSSLCNPGDEIIIIEPFYDCYAPMTEINGAKCVFVPLRLKKNLSEDEVCSSADWKWDEEELESAFTPKTKCIIINTPNNPLGKVYSREELEKVASLCIKHNVLCISDEVYEHTTFERPHFRIATLPGMWERTITVGDAGKAFSITGIKLAWTIGPKELIKLFQVVHTTCVFVCPTFFQEVIARCFELECTRLDKPECYFNSISNELRPKRDYLVKVLQEVGLKPIIPEGGLFVLVDISKFAKDFETDSSEYKDSKFVKYLIKEKGLATIPTTPFYCKDHKSLGENYIRLCFFKTDAILEKAVQIIKNLS